MICFSLDKGGHFNEALNVPSPSSSTIAPVFEMGGDAVLQRFQHSLHIRRGESADFGDLVAKLVDAYGILVYLAGMRLSPFPGFLNRL